MNAAAATFVDDSIETLAALTEGAAQMARAFLAESNAATDPQERRATADLYLRAFQAWRLGVGLAIRIMTPAPIRVAGDADAREPVAAPREPRDDERDRETDYEAVSLPRFLSKLGV